MIRLTRINGREFLLNAELIKFMEVTPDTMITLINGERFIVQEDADEVVARVIDYGRRLRPFRQE